MLKLTVLYHRNGANTIYLSIAQPTQTMLTKGSINLNLL